MLVNSRVAAVADDDGDDDDDAGDAYIRDVHGNGIPNGNGNYLHSHGNLFPQTCLLRLAYSSY